MTPCDWHPSCTTRAVVRIASGEIYCLAHAVRVATREARKHVMARDHGICQYCGKEATDAAHLLGKGPHPWIRYELLNLVALCRRCHRTLDTHPSLKMAWIGERFGPLRLERLLAMDLAGERRGDSVDLANVIRGFREMDLTPAEMAAYASGRWLG